MLSEGLSVFAFHNIVEGFVGGERPHDHVDRENWLGTGMEQPVISLRAVCWIDLPSIFCNIK